MPDNQPNTLGEAILALMKERGLKAFELGEKVSLSPTSVSKIVNGVTRPRQNTFTRMCEVLCETKEDEKKLVAAFTGTELIDEEEDHASVVSNREVLKLRAEQFIERKTQAIAFQQTVMNELEKAEVGFIANYCEGAVSTDIFVELESRRIAIECKANIGRDIDRTIAVSELIAEKLECEVLIVAPFLQGVTDTEPREKIKIITLSDLSSNLQLS